MSDPKFDENPWSAEFWNLTRQGEYIKQYGVEVAKTKAKQAGAKIGQLKPRAPLPFEVRNFVLVKRVGGGLVGAGSSGDGPPE